MSMVIIQAIMAATHITHDMDNKNNNNTTNTEISHQEKMILQVFIGISFFLYNILTSTYEQIKYSNESLV